MATHVLAPDFREFLRLFKHHEVEYLLIGGYAVGAYGYVRYTRDLDVWVARSRANARKIVDALVDFGFAASGLKQSSFMKRHNIVRIGVSPLQLEIHTEISGLDFRSAYSRRIPFRIGNVDVNLISLSDLKENKLASGRPKDLVDLDHLP